MVCCARCSRPITEANPAVGRECLGCIRQELADQAEERARDELIAYVPSGHPTWCAGCGTETCGTDLCLACEDAAVDPHRPVRR